MPKIEDALNVGKKKFKPKRYRAWEYEPQAEQNLNNNEKKEKNLKGKQTVSNTPVAKGKQTVSNAPVVKGKQTVSNAPLTYSIESDFYQTAADRLRLVGIQKRIVDFLADLPLDDEGKTPPVSVLNLLKITGCNNTTLKNALTRLYAKEILFKGASKAGKGGFRIFKFSEEFIKLKAQVNEAIAKQAAASLKGKQKVSKR